MSWPMPPGQWNSSMPMASGPDMNMGSYTPEQWTMMQQQSWQWAQWQQQYAQWQSQYGDKYNQQVQSMQAMGMAPPLPPSNVPPPAPPPPDKPPPPPHENDEPLFGTPKAPAPVPPPNSNLVPKNLQPSSDRHSSTSKMSNTEDNESQQGVNTEALKKLAEEERIFDIQFKKWEEEIEKWKQENVNHPDKQAYSEYEQKFEACRAQLLERRQQMNQKRAKLLNSAPQPINNKKSTGNVSTNVPPPQQYNKSNNYSINVPPVQQSYKDNSGPFGNNRNMLQSHQYNMPYSMQQYNYNKDDRNMNLHDTNQHYDDNEDEYGHIDTDNSFLASSGSAKGIPGLDLVPEDRLSSNQKDVIDITDEQNDGPQSNTFLQQNPNGHQKAPDYSTISQGINNILGDEKIMNILSMVAGQKSNMGNNQSGNTFNVNTPPQLTQPVNNQWNRNDNNYNARFNNRQPMDLNNQNVNCPPQQNQFNNSPHMQRNYDNRQDTPSNQYYDNNSQGNQYGNQNMNIRNMIPPLMQINTQIPRPSIPNIPQKQPEPQHAGPNRRGINENREFNANMHLNMGDRRVMQGYEETHTSNLTNFNPRGLQDNKNPIIPTNAHIVPEQRVQEQRETVMPPMKPKWDGEPLFTPSIIVEYDHKPLRLKARDFIEPVHTFDYNHVSKDGEGVNKRKFEEEADSIFSRVPRQSDVDKDWSQDRHSREMNYRDNRQSRHEVKDDYYDSGRGDNFYQRRFDDRRYEERDRIGRHDDPYREKEYDRTRERERNSGKDNDRNRDLGRLGRDREFVREKDSERDRDLFRDKIYGRDRERDGNRGRDMDKDRDNGRDRERDYARDKYRDRRSDRNRSHSKDRDSRKREASKEIDINNSDSKKMKSGNDFTSTDPNFSNKPKHIVMIDDILEPPGREMRPTKIVIVLRGPPGSGKSYLAKLIRDREAEHGGAARIMSIDDYFMQEGEIEEKDPTTGKIVKKPSLKYEYDESLEESYINSLKRAFKRSITDGYFSFLIYDAVNEQLKGYADIWNYARQNGFQVYICTMETDPQVCFKRNIHNRKLEDIEVICSRFFPTPAHHIHLDATTLLQSASIPEVLMEDVVNDDIVDAAMDEEPELVSTASTSHFGPLNSQWKTTYS